MLEHGTLRRPFLDLLRRPGTRSLLSGMARHLGPTGAGVVVGHRTYQPGDDFRLVDWPLLARTGELHVRLMEQEMDLHLELLVDAGASMGVGQPTTALDRARRSAEGLAVEATAQRFGVVAGSFRDRILDRRAGLRGAAAASGVRSVLEGLEASGSSDPGGAVREALLRDRRRRMIAVLTGTLGDPRAIRGAVHEAVKAGCSLRLVLIEGSPLEEHPLLRRGPIRLPDGRKMDLRGPEARAGLALARRRRRDRALDELRGLPRPAFDVLELPDRAFTVQEWRQ